MVPQKFTPLAELCIQKTPVSFKKQNDEIRNETFRNETMKLPSVHTGVSTKKRRENDRL